MGQKKGDRNGSNRNFNPSNNRQSRRQNIGPNSWRRRGKRSIEEETMNENGEEDNVKEKREKPDPSMINSEYHIVYKRRDSHMDHTSDYHFMEADKFPLNGIKEK